MHHAIGLIELNSIAKGIEAGDAMLKTAEVTLLVAKTICPGKYIVMVGGDVAAVQRSVAAGAGLAEHVLVDQFVIANIHASILPSISGVTPIDEMRAVGVVETYSVGACIESADAAVKAANVVPIRTHLAFGIARQHRRHRQVDPTGGKFLSQGVGKVCRLTRERLAGEL